MTDEIKLYEEFEACEETVEHELADRLDSAGRKTKLDICVTKLRRMLELVGLMDLWSSNEELEELSTRTLSYLLTPAYLAFALDAAGMELHEDARTECLKEVRFLYRQYLECLLMFNLVGFDLPWLHENTDEKEERPVVSTNGQPNFNEQAHNREKKIRRHGQLKQLEETRERLRIEQRRDNDQVLQRELVLVLLRLWSVRVIQELEKIDEELQLLAYATSMKQRGEDPLGPAFVPSTSKIPFLTIEKSERKKRMLGLGYPAVPTVTVDEWFEQMQREQGFGKLPPAGDDLCCGKNYKPRGPDDAAEWRVRHAQHEHGEHHDEDDDMGETNKDEETPEEREQQREKDEWRDMHRRGWGNTDNKG